MATYVIKESDGKIINPGVKGDLDFCKMAFPGKVIEELPVPELSEEQKTSGKKERERAWRNGELERTDTLSLVSDFPKKTELTAYRKALRDWPASADFPTESKRPVLG
tara:strand:+ start:179 stop:502 length:324 start_codon:yes stop_codon:yes gene_type:complete